MDVCTDKQDAQVTIVRVREAVATYTGWRDHVCFAAIATLARRAGCSERSVQYALRRLEAEGTIECLGNRLPSGRVVRSRVYRFACGIRRISPQVALLKTRSCTQRSSSRNPLRLLVMKRSTSHDTYSDFSVEKRRRAELEEERRSKVRLQAMTRDLSRSLAW